MNRKHLCLVLITLELILAPTFGHFVLGIGNIRLSNGTLIPDINRPGWMGNGTLVATTTSLSQWNM